MKIGKGGVLGGSDHRGRSMKDVLAEVRSLTPAALVVRLTVGCGEKDTRR